jgi:hypothetical protein
MEVHVINYLTAKKMKYNLNPKIHTRSCIYTSIDNEARKKLLDWNTRMKNNKNC